MFNLSKGPLACTRIQLNKGVCGTSWAQRKTIVVKNVHEFPGHIGRKLKIILLLSEISIGLL